MVKVSPKPSNKKVDASNFPSTMGEVIFEDKKSFKIHTSYETYLFKDFSYERVP